MAGIRQVWTAFRTTLRAPRTALRTPGTAVRASRTAVRTAVGTTVGVARRQMDRRAFSAVFCSGPRIDVRLSEHGVGHLVLISEPGYWSITAEGALNLRKYLLKGGFLIFDDFEEGQWYNMDAQLLRALPEREWVELDDTHPIFGTFFYVEDIYVPHPFADVEPRYMAVFEDNDPRKRVMVLANHNSDLAEYWEWSASGLFAVDPTNDAHRLGVNYIIYALTH